MYICYLVTMAQVVATLVVLLVCIPCLQHLIMDIRVYSIVQLE